jgi:hypothetical protein
MSNARPEPGPEAADHGQNRANKSAWREGSTVDSRAKDICGTCIWAPRNARTAKHLASEVVHDGDKEDGRVRAGSSRRARLDRSEFFLGHEAMVSEDPDMKDGAARDNYWTSERLGGRAKDKEAREPKDTTTVKELPQEYDGNGHTKAE